MDAGVTTAAWTVEAPEAAAAIQLAKAPALAAAATAAPGGKG